MYSRLCLPVNDRRRPHPLAAGLLALGLVAAANAAPPVITLPPAPQTIFLGDAVTFRVTASGTVPLSYQWFRDGTAVGGATTASLEFTTAATDDNARFTVQVSNATGVVTSPPAALTIDLGMPGPTQTTRLLEITNRWRYNVSQTDLNTAWTAPDYADSGWPAGGGLLYVEDSTLPAPKTTALPVTAGSLPATCYFRTRFTNWIANAYAVRLEVNTVVDDGVVLHLNGAEAFRLGMPADTVTYASPAIRTVGNAAYEGPFDLATAHLVTGTNVLAAEVHQVNTTSSDIVLGLTLDAVWEPRLRDTAAPVVANVRPALGAMLASLTQIEVQFSEGVRGVDAADLQINGVAATQVTAVAPDDYVFRFAPPATGLVKVAWASGHGITDRSANTNAFAGAGFGYVIGEVSSGTRLAFSAVSQSTDASPAHPALQAVDGATATYSLTADLPGSFWLAKWGRPFPLERIELVNRSAPDDAELDGLTLRLFDLDDQVVYGTNLTNPGSGGLAVIDLPAGVRARSLWIGLPGAQTNAAGNHRVGLAEVRAFGVPDLPYGPGPLTSSTNAVRVWQSSEYGGFPAENAVDGDPDTFTHTADVPDSFWMADLGQAFPLTRVEIVNRNSCCDNRLSGLVLRVFDGTSNSVASAVLPNPGLGLTWTYAPAAGTRGRWLRLGLEGGQTNGGGNYHVTLAEARVFSGTTNLLLPSAAAVPVTNNLASFKPSYMLRLDSSVPAAGNANDDNYTTETRTTLRTVDGYWETDLGATYGLYGVRAIAASGIGGRLTNATVRLYNAAHESVFAEKLAGSPDAFDLDLNGPVFARYVRVGLEDKQRTDPAGGIEFYLGFREVEVFGRPTNTIGILSFTASTNRVEPGQDVTLAWAVDDVRRVEIRPALGSVGAYTGPNGGGGVTLAITNSTEFVLVASNAAGIFTRGVAVQAGAGPLPVRLSEIVADNRYSLEDGYGEASDWIELRNPADAPADLTGWGLSDDPARPMKWTFPATSLAPHCTLIVFASGRDTAVDPAGNLHAGFRLEKNGGALLLTARDGVTIVDRLPAYPELDTDLAYGRDLEGNWTFLEPTPGAVNFAPTYQGWLKPPDWSEARGFHDTAFTLTLTNKSPGATLRYSLDGSVPSVPYTTGLAITGTVAVRAQAVRAGFKPARIQTRTFLFVDDVIASSVMNPAITRNPAYAPRMRSGLLALPSISICVPGQPEYEEREGSLEVLWPDGGDPVQVNCGISRFGNAWTKYEKRSLRMKCRARYGEARLHAPLFNGFDRGVLAQTSFDELDFRSGSQDMFERGFYMAGRFVEDSLLDMGSLNPHGRFVHLYLNGVYWGQYDCRELLVEPFLADYLGGSKDDYVAVRGNDNVGDDFVLGAPEPPNLLPWERVRSLSDSYPAVRPYLDVPHLIDFMLLWNYGDSESEFRACGPLNAGSGFKFWIADADGFLRTEALGLNRTSRNGPGDTFSGLVNEGHPDFKMLLADRIYRHCFNQGALTPAANEARLTARMQEVHDSLLAECARWGYRTPASWESSAAAIRSSLFPARTAQLVGYLRSAGLYPTFDPPTFNSYGGLVTNGFQPELTSSKGTIYYTLDGSDPRLAGGSLSPAARVWSPGAITITNDLTLSVRVRNASGQWSALAEPRFLLATRRVPTARDLLVTEINYHPADSEDYEFVELWNASTNLLDLSGVSLNNAVRYVFPGGFALAPGAFVMVAHDPAAFAVRYQSPASPWYRAELAAVGPWAGALNNAGETLSLVASNGVELASVPYRTGGDWPERADGHGSSIELRAFPPETASDAEVQTQVAQGANWGASSLYHGSPGRLDSFVRTVRINEVLSHPGAGGDWLELENSGSEPVDLTGCTLTDTLDRPARWTFPASTRLAPGELRLLTAVQLGFAFSERGDDAALLQMSGTNVLRFLDTVDFPAARPEESFGTFQRSDGTVDFTELRTNTPGGANALPRVGPVVVSEILFTPAPGKAGFLELANLTGAAVPLFDPARPTNVWTLEGVGRFAFPTNTWLPPCSTVIVCATNPAAFRAQYGLNPSVPVLGPWAGALAADGETLRLLQAGPPELDGTVPYYRVDHVTYRTNAPWPSTRPGVSLERVPVEGYGNDPASWRTGPVNGTPGLVAENRLPVLHADGALTVTEQSPMKLTISVADLDAPWQTATCWATRLPPGSTFDESSGILTWTPTEPQGPGIYQAEFAATDNAACGAGFALLPLTLAVQEANLPPAWLPQADVQFPAGLPWEIPLHVSDPDVPIQPLHFDAVGLPPGLYFESRRLRILGTGTEPGDYPVVLSASDGQQPPLNATLSFVMRLTEPFALTARLEVNGVWLSFPTLVGETYRIEFCDDLALPDWRLLEEISRSPDRLIRVFDPGAAGQSQRFYRVRWLH